MGEKREKYKIVMSYPCRLAIAVDFNYGFDNSTQRPSVVIIQQSATIALGGEIFFKKHTSVGFFDL